MEFIAAVAQPVRAGLSALWERANSLFMVLFVFRYLRFVIHLVSYFLYRPSPIPASPLLTEDDCTVVIPTCAPQDPAFRRCVESIVQAAPDTIHIVAVGEAQENQVYVTIAHLIRGFPNIHFRVSHSPQANKRRQVAIAIESIQTSITVLCDDHVIWPSSRFLSAALAPFDDDASCGGVGTKKRVIRRENTGAWQGFWNVMGALLLERHNFEHTASNAVDGGVAVISGRTCLYRTRILQDSDFLEGYLNEKFFFGRFGPLNADDDNYITRKLVKQGWKIKFQNTADATILCEVGEYPKFLQQCLRWARTTFRSNMCSLITDRVIYQSLPWTVYALMISQMINFAFFYDLGLIFTLTRTDFYTSNAVKALCLWIILSKLPKLLPYFWRQPMDLLYLPAYYLFAYFHSFIKLWALLTFFDVSWSGRKLDCINAAAVEDNSHSVPGSGSGSGSGSRPRRRISSRPTSRPVNTPWGFVAPVNLHNSPANVRQNQTSGGSWPADWSLRRRNVHQAHGYPGEGSPTALDFENNLATQEDYPTPVSMSRGSGYQRSGSSMVTPSRTSSRLALPTPPRSPPTPFQTMSTPSLAPRTPTRSWVRVDDCDRLHELCYWPRRRCKL